MSLLRNIAITVQELEPGEFHWVLLEAVDGLDDEMLPYQLLETSCEAYASYGDALVLGLSAMRRMFGPKGPLKETPARRS
ncbi:hypothetical protein PGB34_05695 [Xenophilus arseniciresistens]|uniref:Uncharacterized protein n=1 Tax=Xenophilus arseniciresistens TaxID=1283306 RepID=A0AAE3T022_9BURK|nr:hypothetical protein [Xenophilus arseniciresistens]MDA7415852.1 hypothetical protein [Xenophilus arseniciresistens]